VPGAVRCHDVRLYTLARCRTGHFRHTQSHQTHAPLYTVQGATNRTASGLRYRAPTHCANALRATCPLSPPHLLPFPHDSQDCRARATTHTLSCGLSRSASCWRSSPAASLLMPVVGRLALTYCSAGHLCGRAGRRRPQSLRRAAHRQSRRDIRHARQTGLRLL